MLSGHGSVDTLAVHGPRIYSADTTKSVANQFAAMPSLHFGWSVMVAVALIAVTRRRVRWLALAHPALTLLAIVATANHYFADAAVALVLVAVGAVAVQWGWSRTLQPAASRAGPGAGRPSARCRLGLGGPRPVGAHRSRAGRRLAARAVDAGCGDGRRRPAGGDVVASRARTEHGRMAGRDAPAGAGPRPSARPVARPPARPST